MFAKQTHTTGKSNNFLKNENNGKDNHNDTQTLQG